MALRNMWLVAAGMVLASAAHVGAGDQETFARVCTRCHSMEGHTPSERSHKAWELTVERMTRYAENNEMTAFTTREAEAILRFLITFPEGKVLELEHVTVPTHQPAPGAPDGTDQAPAGAIPAVAIQGPAAPAGPAEPASQPATSPALAAAGMPRSLPPLPPPPLPPPLLAWAKLTGYVAIVVLGALVLSGLTRRRFGKAFPRVHVTLAAMLAACALFHSVVFVWRYGAPSILWFWFGLIALGIIVAALLAGTYRRRMKGLLFRLHKAAALAALVLTVLHWVWFYL